jgi:hypothetical protein
LDFWNVYLCGYIEIDGGVMTDLRKAAEALIKALDDGWVERGDDVVLAIRQALAQDKQEPVAWMFEDDEDNGHKSFRSDSPSPEKVAYLAKWNRPAWTPLYTAPSKREWVGLTDDEIKKLYLSFVLTNNHSEPSRFVRAIEAKLKEKNT